MAEKKIELNRLSEENTSLKNNINEHNRFRDLLLQICLEMSSIVEKDKLVAYFVHKSAELFKVKRVSFMLLDKTTQELSLESAQGIDVSVGKVRVKVGEAFGGWVVKEGTALLVKDVEEEYPELSKNRLSRYTTRSFIIIPVKIRDEIIGIFNITDKREDGVFSEEDLKMANLAMRYFALAIENIRLSEKNTSLTTIDPLTGLFNHRYFHEQLLEEIYRAERYHHNLSLLIIDIDNFKDYNQANGYPLGDSALRQIANIIRENTRKVDVASRYGPEEFTVIFPEIKTREAIMAAEKLREKVATAVFAGERQSAFELTRITVSIGVCGYRVGTSKEELISQAESALAEAKQQGKNKVCIYKRPLKFGF